MRIFLGGYPGAGKTSFARYLSQLGWYSLDMDRNGVNPDLQFLDVPQGHPAFAPEPLVVEGGFLQDAPRFQEMIRRHNLRTVWLTGTKEQLSESRLQRNASWDDPKSIKTSDWVGLVDRYRNQVHWDRTIRMWRDDGTRKTPEEVYSELFTSS